MEVLGQPPPPLAWHCYASQQSLPAAAMHHAAASGQLTLLMHCSVRPLASAATRQSISCKSEPSEAAVAAALTSDADAGWEQEKREQAAAERAQAAARARAERSANKGVGKTPMDEIKIGEKYTGTVVRHPSQARRNLLCAHIGLASESILLCCMEGPLHAAGSAMMQWSSAHVTPLTHLGAL